jgi:hypothetical protein
VAFGLEWNLDLFPQSARQFFETKKQDNGVSVGVQRFVPCPLSFGIVRLVIGDFFKNTKSSDGTNIINHKKKCPPLFLHSGTGLHRSVRGCCVSAVNKYQNEMGGKRGGGIFCVARTRQVNNHHREFTHARTQENTNRHSLREHIHTHTQKKKRRRYQGGIYTTNERRLIKT